MIKYLASGLLIVLTSCTSTSQKITQPSAKKGVPMTQQEQVAFLKEIESKKCPNGKHSVWINTDDKGAITSITKIPAVICWIDISTLGEVKSEESGPAYGYQVEATSDKEAQQLVKDFQNVNVEAQVRSGWGNSNG